MISRPIMVKALDDFKLQIEFEDGVKGEISLSHLQGKGIFKLWNDYENFKKVYIDEESLVIAWNRDMEVDSNNLYLILIGKTFEQWRSDNLKYASDK